MGIAGRGWFPLWQARGRALWWSTLLLLVTIPTSAAASSAWLDQLRSNDGETRLAASFDWSLLPADPAARRQSLLAAMVDPDPLVRRGGFAAAGEFATADGALIQLLVAGLADRDAYAAAHAAVALGKIGPPAALPVLDLIDDSRDAIAVASPGSRASLRDARITVGDLAAATLTLMGPRVLDLVDQRVREVLASSAAAEHAAERRRLHLVVRHQGPAAVPLLRRWLKDPVGELREWAAADLRRLGPAWRSEVPMPPEADALFTDLRSPDGETRARAARSLRVLALERPDLAPEVADAMVRLLVAGDDTDADLAIGTLTELRGLGLRAILGSLADPELRTAQRLGRVIAGASPETPDERDALTSVLAVAAGSRSELLRQLARSEGSGVPSAQPLAVVDRCASARALQSNLGSAQEFRAQVTQALVDCPEVGLERLQARAERGPEAAAEVYEILAGAENQNVACALRLVPPVATRQLRQELDRRVEELRRALRGESSEGRRAAALCLAEAGVWGASALDQLAALSDDAEFEVAVAAAEAVTRIAAAVGNNGSVYRLLSSRQPRVRVLAIETLAALSGRETRPGAALSAAAIDSAVASIVAQLMKDARWEAGTSRSGGQLVVADELPKLGAMPPWTVCQSLPPDRSSKPTAGSLLASIGKALDDLRIPFGLFAVGEDERDGFAIVTRPERLGLNGVPLSGQDRWADSIPIASWKDYLERLFMAPPGHYRSFVFVVTPRSNVYHLNTGGPPAAKPWSLGGLNLSSRLSEIPAETWFVHVIVYEYQRKLGRLQALEESSMATVAEHLERAGLSSVLPRR